MAFVFMKERDISPEMHSASGDIGPGQYLPQGYMRPKGKTSKVGFNSNTFRGTRILKDDGPGPGSYEYDEKYENFINLLNEKQTKPLSLLKSMEMVNPDNLDPFTIIIKKENSKEVAFYSKEKRFKEKPGYDVGIGYNENNNKMFLVRNSVKKKKVKMNINRRKKSEKSLVKIEKGPISPFRVATIPSKNLCFGFNINEQGEVYLKNDPDKDYKFDGDKMDSVGPGAYNLENNKNWRKGTVAWDRQSKSKRNSIATIEEICKNNNHLLGRNNNSQLLEESLKLSKIFKNENFNLIQKSNNYLISPKSHKYSKSINNLDSVFLLEEKTQYETNKQDKNNFIQLKKENILSNIKNRYEKEKVFKHIRENRQKLLDLKVSKNNLDDELFNKHILNQDPGPGYYYSELANCSFKPVKVAEKFQYFGSNSLRFSDPNFPYDISDVGPGAYFKDDNKLERLQLRKMIKKQNFSMNSKTLQDEIKKNRIVSLEERIGINGIMNQQKFVNVENTPGPADYNINSELFNKKSGSNLHHFGSLQKRFNDTNDSTPGPGSYIGMPKVESVNHVKFQVKPKKIILKKEEPLQQDFLVSPKETLGDFNGNTNSPPVGSYSPEIVTSVGYKVARNVNKFNNSSAPFNIIEKRFNDLRKNDTSENVGPGYYYRDSIEKKILHNLHRNSPPFNTSAERKYPNDNKYVYSDNGPGSYHLSSYFDWNKKSFNVQFI